MVRGKFSIVALGLFLAFSTFAANYELVTQKKLINGDTLSEYKFSNGLRLLTVPRHQAKVLSYQTWFKVGSVDEKMDQKLKKTGLAHLFEHMMFRGSVKYPDGKFDEISARMGSDRQNATTYYYRTNYFQNIPSHHLDSLMELESDRMRNLNLTKEIFEKEKGAVVGEFRRHLDSPTSMAWDTLMETAFETTPYRYTVLGTEEEIKGFSLEEAQYFYKTFYAPNNGTLIIIGDVEEKKLLKLVEKYYGDMSAQTIPDVKVGEEPPQKKERRVERTHQQATSEILVVGYRAPGINHDDIAPLNLLSTHLSRGTEARLRKLLVNKGIAVNASASVSSQPDLFEFSVQLSEGRKADDALRIIDQEISSLNNKKISKESFERALNQELLNLYGDISDNSELGNWLGEFLVLSGNYMKGFEMIETLKSLKPEDLQRVSKQYLKRDQRSVVVMRPQRKENS